jgi:hypothetical protein
MAGGVTPDWLVRHLEEKRRRLEAQRLYQRARYRSRLVKERETQAVKQARLRVFNITHIPKTKEGVAWEDAAREWARLKQLVLQRLRGA